jgi:hypothetical protein
MAIEIKIGASFNDRDIKKAQRELENLAKVSERSSQTMAQKLGAAGQSFQRIGQTMTTGLTAPLVAVGALSVKAFMDQEDAIAKMEATLKATGGVAGVTSDHIQNLAGSLQKTTTFADEATVGAGALLLTFKNVSNQMGEGNDIFDRTIKASQDLSSLMGTDLNTSVMMLGKALQDPETGLTRLTRVGIQFTEQQKDQIKTLAESGDMLGAQRIMLKEIESQFGGTATAMANTASGKLKKAMNQLGEAGEAIGAAIAPTLEKVASFISGVGTGLAGLPGPLQTVVIAFGALVAAAGPVIWATGLILTNLQAIAATKAAQAVGMAFGGLQSAFAGAVAQGGVLGGVLGGVNTAFSRMGSLLLKGGIVLGGLALVGTVVRQIAGSAADAKLGDFATDVDRTAAALTQFGNNGSINEAVISVQDFQTAAMMMRRELYSSENANNQPPIVKQLMQLPMHFNGIYEESDKARERMEVFDDALMKMDFGEAQTALQAYFDTMGWGKLSVEKVADILPQFAGKLADSTAITDPAARAILGLGDGFDATGEEIDAAATSLQRWEEKVRAQFDPLWGYQDSVQQLVSLKTEEAEKQAAVNAAIAQYGVDSDEARVASEELRKVQQDQIVAAGAQKASWDDLVAGINSGEMPISKAIADIDKLAQEGLISAEAARQQKREFENLAAFLLAAEFPDVVIPVNSNALEVLETLKEIERFLRDEAAFIKTVGITDWVLGAGNDGMKPWNPNSADGGPVMANRIGWVGERGPELFIPPVDGTIVPHYQSRRIMDELGRQDQPTATPQRSGDIYVTVNKSDADPYEIGRELLWTMKVAG